MPTQHVEPQSDNHLDDVSNSLLRARRVVVITGAGISTNSGIPDFRSENGLYSLVQAQFDAAARQARRFDPAASAGDCDGRDEFRLTKRRKICCEDSAGFPDDEPAQAKQDSTQSSEPKLSPSFHHKTADEIEPVAFQPEDCDGLAGQPLRTPQPKLAMISTTDITTSPLSSPPADDMIIPPSTLRSPTHKRLVDVTLPQSSSPLSSPPPALFDSFIPSSPSAAIFSRRSSTSASEADSSTPASNPLSSSHTCNSSRGALLNMKGKDLFDATIWSDPIRTSVFYTFATSLRQKIKMAEPSSSHRFISHLRDRGKLVRCYTQNIDQIEEKLQISSIKCHPRQDLQTGLKRDLRRSGVECVFLHGSLELLRCFLCGNVCSWDDDEREAETLTGQQPECPHCVGATAAREERGKRALGVGKLRPDIVLYGEEHPSSHLISPIVTHDLALHPDMLLILGTSLRVHGLKVMVREFAKAVHSKGGKVVFVNFTKPPESSWGDVIDYWVQWDCDAWVADLQGRIPTLWQDRDLPRPKKKRESGGAVEGKQKGEKKRQPAANPVALRDTKATGAYWTAKVLQELGRITEKILPARRASMVAGEPTSQSTSEPSLNALRKKGKAKPKPSRKSAPGALEKPIRPCSALNPGHGRAEKRGKEAAEAAAASVDNAAAISSILNLVKENPRIRKRKVIDGEEVAAPCAPRRRGRNQSYKAAAADLKLPPLRSPPAQQSTLPCLYGRPEPLEPRSPPSGPLASLSPNLRTAKAFRANPLYLDDPMHLLDSAPRWSPFWGHGEDGGGLLLGSGNKETEASRGSGFKEPGASGSKMMGGPPPGPSRVSMGNLEGELMDWGANWSCKR
ncbi:sir2 family protein [Hirsutella rhossiliensis]|uniref:Sir2 family domain-containing protein n=1 Tax=Hirsutella rhossiliensis TaxID=111463 RepID=A0A9P8SP14_9HYPO|nr:sir2 family domain-containing protein [Hirsutella rhossiliensis]KAH0967716.1 sir2 family domain-containing protein [Hirsutella rhossiliensis]